MIFSYRTRRFFRRLFSVILTIVLLACAFLAIWLLWAQRYIIYTQDGPILDFGLKPPNAEGIVAGPTVPGETVPIDFGKEEVPEEETPPPPEETMEQLKGYYLTVDDLSKDLEAILKKLETLPKGTPILMDVKGTWGYFFYSTSLGGTTSTSFDMEVMDAFFQRVNALGLYTIARLPAFADYDFARKNYTCGLKTESGSLWGDENNCFWLDPTDDLVLTYLVQVAKELKSMGFAEVVFKNFYVPTANEIVYKQDRAEAIKKAAKTLVTACASKDFVVSFISGNAGFPLPEGNCRLYLENVGATQVQDVLQKVQVKDYAINLVFFATSNDTRYEAGGVLRPLEMAP